MLTLPIKKRWFDMILSGAKKEEYRELTPYYDSRLHKLCGNPFVIIRFRNGYNSTSPFIDCRVFIRRGMEGNPEWGAEKGVKYYNIQILEIIGGQSCKTQ